MKMLQRLCSVLFGVVAIIFLVAGLWANQQAPAAPPDTIYTVDTEADLIDNNLADGICPAGSCSLRAAIMQANVMPVAGVTIIVPALPPGHAYTLIRPVLGANGPDEGDLNLTAPPGGSDPLITIVGAGEGTTFVDSNGGDRVLAVAAGRRAAISGLTIRHGRLSGAGSGGGIYNAGILKLTQVTLLDNRAYFGGGITNSSGTLTITRCTFNSNQANYGGAIYNPSGTLSVIQSTIGGNTAIQGGGILNSSAPTALVLQTTISSNLATSDGGGIYNSGQLAVVNSTISQNSANNNGGGIFNSGGAFSVINLYSSSVVFNLADADADVNGGTGGGIWNSAGGTFTLRHTLVAGNTATDPQAGYDDATGVFDAYGWNLFWVVSGATINTFGSTWGTLSSLADIGPLQNNGGPTLTHALQASSNPIGNPIDAGGLPAACIDNNSNPLTTDERGFPRTVDGDGDGVARCDIGAFEFKSSLTLKITAATRPANGHVILQGVGSPSGLHTIAASPDLSPGSFVNIGSATADASGVLQYDDAGSVGLTKRFYHVSFP
jgi:polymorphic membrane protein